MSRAENAAVLPVTWRKSSYSDSGSNCVELGALGADTTVIRDSKDPTGPALLLGRAPTAGFVSALRDGGLGAAP
jgi:hypothetical protein